LSKKLQKAINNDEIPQMINISKLSREGASDIITYVWEDQSITKAKKAEMRKKGDYSYINRGLFKKVYDSAGNPIIFPSTSKDGITYLSYVYKAINTWGDSFRANEFYGKMFPNDADSTLAQQGVFDNGYMKVNEVEDSVIENIMGDDAISELNLAPVSTSEKINIYAGTGENAQLSNFAVRPFETADGLDFQTVEGAFQAAKLNYSLFYRNNFDAMEDIRLQLQENSGASAKALGRQIKGLDTKAWDANSSRIMKDLLKASFEQNPSALKTLLETGNAELTHTQDNTKWGKEFPKLLMEVRDELNPTKKEDPFPC
jgi:ribA/ribD-fused uncharacterized protein